MLDSQHRHSGGHTAARWPPLAETAHVLGLQARPFWLAYCSPARYSIGTSSSLCLREVQQIMLRCWVSGGRDWVLQRWLGRVVLNASRKSCGRQGSHLPASIPLPRCPHQGLSCSDPRTEGIHQSLTPGLACELASYRPAKAGREQGYILQSVCHCQLQVSAVEGQVLHLCPQEGAEAAIGAACWGPTCLPGMVHLHIHVHTHGGLPAHLYGLQVSRWAAGHVLMIWQAQLQSSSEGSLAALPCTQCG